MGGIELTNAVVMITGACGGIGTALTDAFRDAGATVVRTDLAGRRADIELNVTDAAATAEVMRRIIDEHGKLDVVIANAGIGVAGLVDHLDTEGWQRTIDVNIGGTINTVLAALPVLEAGGGGSIVLMASLAGLAGTPLLTPYAMSKSAIVVLGESLRPEAARHGIGVTVVCPGPVETPLLDEPSSTPGVSVRRYLIAAAGQPIAAAELAEAVVAGVRRNAALITPGRAAFLWRINRLLPGVVRRMSAARMRKELVAAADATKHEPAPQLISSREWSADPA
jgi:NAD(P)-dependent dehydrogenase (short-subunit alcohol dehydrogenase family)